MKHNRKQMNAGELKLIINRIDKLSLVTSFHYNKDYDSNRRYKFTLIYKIQVWPLVISSTHPNEENSEKMLKRL